MRNGMQIGIRIGMRNGMRIGIRIGIRIGMWIGMRNECGLEADHGPYVISVISLITTLRSPTQRRSPTQIFYTRRTWRTKPPSFAPTIVKFCASTPSAFKTHAEDLRRYLHGMHTGNCTTSLDRSFFNTVVLKFHPP